MKIISFVLVLLLFSACGYVPSAKYSREIMGESISTSVKISMVDPENTVIIKDAIDSAIIEVFHASLTTKALAKTHLVLTLSNPRYEAVQYDKEGFVVAYRAYINLDILRDSDGDKDQYETKGTYDFSIAPNAVITDKQRFDAIRYSSIKAIKSFVSQVSADGSRASKNKDN